MFNHLIKKQIKNVNGAFEVYDRETGELLGAILHPANSPEQISRNEFQSPYEVYYKGRFICYETASPRAMKVISDLHAHDTQKRGKGN